jgi:hypothetical protein
VGASLFTEREVKRRRPTDIEKALANDRLIEATLAAAVREALRRHKQAGHAVAEWRNGKTVWIPADAIEVDTECSARKRRASRN